MNNKPIYLCDPEKNVNCPKDICLSLGRGECIYTSDPRFAINLDMRIENNESFKKKQTNQDKIAEMVRTMDTHELALLITNGIERCQKCPAEKYCDQHACIGEEDCSRVPDENGELLDCNQIFER